MTASCVCERRAGGGMGGIMAARGRRCQCLEGMGKWDSGEEFLGVLVFGDSWSYVSIFS